MSSENESSGVPGAPPPLRRSWPENWVRAVLDLGSVSAARRATVLEDVEIGSLPTLTYYVLLGISELIAGFALIVNSDATLIGANVVAPLMTPIIGVSLGLMRGDLRLLRTALLAEFGGALFGVVLTYLLGLLPISIEPSTLLLSQTHPTLIDLMVAALAGFAGVLAMIDERVSPALPGVAIATALNPPVAAIGLCLAYGAYAGAWGAFLLFFANVLAILAVAAVVFLIAGFVTRAEIGSVRGLARRFAAAAIGLLLVTGLLTQYLFGMINNIRTQRTIKVVLDQELAREPSTALASVDFSALKDGIDVLAEVRTPHVIDPRRVKEIQDVLGNRLAEPVRLFMRCDMTKDVTATGSTTLRPYLSLDGKVATALISPDMQLLQQAEQLAREVAVNRADVVLKDIQLVSLATGPVVIVSIEGARPPAPENIARFEQELRKRSGDERARLVVRTADSVDMTSKGRVLYGQAHFGAGESEDSDQQRRAEEAARATLQRLPNMFVTAVDAVRSDSGWAIRAEVVGPRVLAPNEVRGAEDQTRAAIGEGVELEVRMRTDLLVTGTRYEPVGDVRSSGQGAAPPS